MKKIPEPKFYSVALLAKKWGCDPEAVLNYGRTGQLRMSILNREWEIECISVEEHEDKTLHGHVGDVICPKGKLLKLTVDSAEEIISKGSAAPRFECEGYDYARILSHRHREDIIVEVKELLIDPDDVLALEGSVQGAQKASPISVPALERAYKQHVKENESAGTIPTWKEDQEAMTKALDGKKPTDKQIKQIRKELAPKHWKQQGRRKKRD